VYVARHPLSVVQAQK
jgi:hypothetical protein